MQKPAYERHGDSFFLTWQDKGIAFGINRLNDKGFYGLQGYLTVEAITPEQRGIAFGPVIIGLENVKGQREMADTLAERVNGMDKSTWLTLVAQACSKVSQEWRAGSPTVDLRDLAADAGPVQFMWDRLIPVNETTAARSFSGRITESTKVVAAVFSLARTPRCDSLVSIMTAKESARPVSCSNRLIVCGTSFSNI